MPYTPDDPELEDRDPEVEIIEYPELEPEVGEEPDYIPGTWVVD